MGGEIAGPAPESADACAGEVERRPPSPFVLRDELQPAANELRIAHPRAGPELRESGALTGAQPGVDVRLHTINVAHRATVVLRRPPGKAGQGKGRSLVTGRSDDCVGEFRICDLPKVGGFGESKTVIAGRRRPLAGFIAASGR